MLRRQINLHIGISVVRHVMGGRRLPVDGRPLSALAPLKLSDQLLCLLPHIHPPAIVTQINRDLFPVAGHELSLMKNGIVFFPQRIDICLDRFRVKRHLSALAHNPARNGICVQNFPLRSKCIGYGRIHIVLQLFKCLPEGRIFRSHLRFLITPCRLQIYLFFQTVYAFTTSMVFSRFRRFPLVSATSS